MRKDTVLDPYLPKEQNPIPARHLNSRFLVLFLSLVPNFIYKRSAKCCIPPIADHPSPAVFVWGEGGWLLHRFSQGLEGSMEQVRSAKAGDQRGAQEGYDGKEGRTQAGSDGKGKERKLHFFCPSHHSFRPLSLTINSNTVSPKKRSRATGNNAGEGRGGRGCTRDIDHEG